MAQTNQGSLLNQVKSHGLTKELGLDQPMSQGSTKPRVMAPTITDNLPLIDFVSETSVCDLWALYYPCPDATHLTRITFVPREFASVHTTVHSLTRTHITWFNNLWFSLGISLK